MHAKPLRNEAEELIAIFVTIVKNVKSRSNKEKRNRNTVEPYIQP